jgi:hypothetical protein
MERAQAVARDRAVARVRRDRRRPTFPSSLKPGRVWTGTVSGVGAVPRGKAISVAFGFFVDASSKL